MGTVNFFFLIRSRFLVQSLTQNMYALVVTNYGTIVVKRSEWLVRSSTDRTVRVRALAGEIVLCSWARHFTLTVPLSTQEYKWVPAICWGKPNKLLGSDLRWTSIPSRGSRNTPSRFLLRKPLRPDEPVGSIRLTL